MMETIDPSALARVVILWIWIWLATQLAWGLYSLWAAVAEIGASTDDLMIEGLAGGLALLALGTFLVSGYLILRWVYRTNKNAHQLSADMEVSPGGSVGWFFVPIANLFKPYQSIRQTWQVSHGGDNWPAIELPPELKWWWGLWIVSNILGNISFRLSMRDELSAATASNYLEAISALVSIPLALLLVRIVRALTDAQVRAIQGNVFA